MSSHTEGDVLAQGDRALLARGGQQVVADGVKGVKNGALEDVNRNPDAGHLLSQVARAAVVLVAHR